MMMKKTTFAGAALAAVFFGGAAMAQVSPNSVSQTATRLDSGGVGAQSNTTALTTNSTVTATAAAVAGQYFYVTAIAADLCQDSTGGTAFTQTVFTTTNLGGLFFPVSLATTASLCSNVVKEVFAVPLRSAAPGTATTCVSPAAVSHAIAECRLYGYYGF